MGRLAAAAGQVTQSGAPTFLAFALHYAARGWPVIPLHSIRRDGRCTCGNRQCSKNAGKHPRGGLGIKHASSDPEVIREWWGRWPAANIGVYLAGAGLAAIDIDPRNGGDLEALPEPLDTLTARTGGGGWHLLVQAPELASFPGGLGPGIDVKHEGYIVVEPSLHQSGKRYGFVDWVVGDPLPAIAPAPLWMLRKDSRAGEAADDPVGVEVLTEEQLADLEATLDTIPSDDRDTWVRVGLACATIAGGRHYWLKWSERSEKFDQADADRVWESLKPGPGMHWKWILRHAEELGGRNVHVVARRPSEAAGEPDAPADGPSEGAWSFANFATLDTDPPPPRRWVVQDWIPACSVTALFGGGGIGKSLIAQQLGTHIAIDEPIFGLAVEQGPVLILQCEDDPPEARRRAQSIERRAGLRIGDAPIYVAARAGEDNVLVGFDRDGRLQYAPAWADLVAAIERIRPVLVVIDNVAHVFGGLENDRRHVTAFANALTALARKYECAVLLIGHVAKAEGSEFSGSTAWEAAVRTRLWLERKDDGAVVLHKKKANYSTRDAVTLEWADGAFALPVPQDQRARNRLAERTVLAGLATLTARQVATSHSAASATSYLPRLMQREGLLNGVSFEDAKRALGSLIDAQAIEPNAQLPWKKPDRKWAMGLKATGLPLEHLA
jgi:hypothetical protein